VVEVANSFEMLYAVVGVGGGAGWGAGASAGGGGGGGSAGGSAAATQSAGGGVRVDRAFLALKQEQC